MVNTRPLGGITLGLGYHPRITTTISEIKAIEKQLGGYIYIYPLPYIYIYIYIYIHIYIYTQTLLKASFWSPGSFASGDYVELGEVIGTGAQGQAGFSGDEHLVQWMGTAIKSVALLPLTWGNNGIKMIEMIVIRY